MIERILHVHEECRGCAAGRLIRSPVPTATAATATASATKATAAASTTTSAAATKSTIAPTATTTAVTAAKVSRNAISRISSFRFNQRNRLREVDAGVE